VFSALLEIKSTGQPSHDDVSHKGCATWFWGPTEQIVEKAEQDKPFGDFRWNAARFKIKALARIDRAHRRGMAAPDIIFLDVEIRDGIGVRSLGQD
jgi:hypothetical protein